MGWIFSFLDWFSIALLRLLVDSLPQRCVKLVAFYHPDPWLRKMYWERLGVRMGEGTLANLGMTVVRGKQDPCLVIGRNVSIAPNLTFICDSGANNGREINRFAHVRERLTKTARITVEDEAWIGADVTIMPGVTVGRCSVVGAKSLLLHDTRPFGVYAGAPARMIRRVTGGGKAKRR